VLLLRCMQLLHAIFPPSMPSFLLLVSTVRYVLSTYVARPMQRNCSFGHFCFHQTIVHRPRPCHA